MLLLFGAGWLVFAPMQFGGQAAYVIVNGNSMEPVYHQGDLVVLHSADDYQVGDIATYRHPDIGPVIHRIIAHDQGHFTFKGDHNTWTDVYRPMQAELIGKAWVYLPSAGKLVEQARAPHTMAILAGAIGFFFMTTITTDNQAPRSRRQRRRFLPVTVQFVVNERSGPTLATAPLGHLRGDTLATARELLLFALGALGFAALLLAALAFTRPTERIVDGDVSYQQSGTFSYKADAPHGIYDTDWARSGDALFLRLSDHADMTFAYRATADQPAQFGGSYLVNAQLSDGAGWRRTVALQPETVFRGNEFDTAVRLDFAQIEALIESFEQQTELGSQQYVLAIVPQVTLNGRLAGHELQDTFAPRLEFRFDKARMQLISSDPAADPLKPVKTDLLKSPHSEPNTLTLLDFNLTVAAARRLALVGILLALGGALALHVAFKRLVGRDEAARIQNEYGPLLLDVRAGALEANSRTIEVAAIADLAKLAEREGRMIFHQIEGDGHHYFVHDNDVIYLYQLPVTVDTITEAQAIDARD